MGKQEELNEYIEKLLEGVIKPFFREALPSFYDEGLDITIDFQDSRKEGDIRIQANKTTSEISYHIGDTIQNTSNIGNELSTFGATLGTEYKSDPLIERRLIDLLLLVHECTHKYHEALVRRTNASERFMSSLEDCYDTHQGVRRKWTRSYIRR